MSNNHPAKALSNANYIHTVSSMTEPPFVSSNQSSHDNPNSAMIPMYWVGGQWMVPSSAADQSQTMGTAGLDPFLLLTHGDQSRPRLETATTRFRSHHHNAPPSMEPPSNPSPNPPYWHRHSSEPTANITSSNVGYFKTPQSPLPPGELAGETTTGSSKSAIHYHPEYRPTAPTRVPFRFQQPTEWSSRDETRSDTRIAAATYGERRHKAHLDSEKRRRESINTGFNSLRQVLPANNESDSRATTLRKAVDYVNHLESLLQELRRDRPIAQNRGGDRAYIKGESE